MLLSFHQGDEAGYNRLCAVENFSRFLLGRLVTVVIAFLASSLEPVEFSSQLVRAPGVAQTLTKQVVRSAMRLRIVILTSQKDSFCLMSGVVGPANGVAMKPVFDKQAGCLQTLLSSLNRR